MDWQLLVTVLAAVGGPAGIAALFLLLPQIKKLQADTAKVEADSELAEVEGAARLSEAALAQMKAALDTAASARSEAAQARQEAAACRAQMDAVVAEMRAYREAAQEHVAWDVQRVQELVSMGVDPLTIPKAPSLLPPGSQRSGATARGSA